MQQFSPKIKNEFFYYTQLVTGIKTVHQEIISLKNKTGSHRRWRQEKIEIDYFDSELGVLSIRQAKSLLKDYGFQVFHQNFDKPLIRFDADGATHYNSDDDSLSLGKREIRTPHFHQFNENGYEFAFRTLILDEKENDIQENINLGFEHFCLHYSILCETGSKIFIIEQTEMFPDEVSDDLHKGVNFL